MSATCLPEHPTDMRIAGEQPLPTTATSSLYRHGLSYEIAKQPKSDLYRDLMPLLNSGRILLPKHDRLVSQIVGPEGRVSRAGIRLTSPRTDTTTWRMRRRCRRCDPGAVLRSIHGLRLGR
jgi:hypothetical protein